MPVPPRKPTVPEVLPLMRAYRAKPGNNVGGDFHIVLDDDNVDDSHVEWCLERARGKDDPDGIALGEALLAMSKTQRLKLAYHSYRRHSSEPEDVEIP